MLDQFLLLSTLQIHLSNFTNLEFTTNQTVRHKILTMVFLPLVSEKKMVTSISWSRIHGPINGVMVVTSKWLVAKRIIVELPPTQFTHLSPTQITNSNVLPTMT